MIDPSETAGMVIGNTGGAAVKRLFRLGPKYDWVKDFLRDQQIRKTIQSLRQKISETQNSPFHKTELREYIKTHITRINGFRRQQLTTVFADFQARKEPMLLTEISIGKIYVLNAPWLPFMISVSDKELDALLSELPEGVRGAEIEKRINELSAEILEFEGILNTELSPQDRWFYRETGLPIPYPRGCRWTAFVETWQKVAARFVGCVSIEGFEPQSEDEATAYYELGLDRVLKLTPLREPINKRAAS